MKAPITINLISIIKAIGAMKRISKYNRIKNICLFRSKTMDRHCNITGEKCFFKSCQRFALVISILITFSSRAMTQQLICETGSFVAHIVYVKERVYDDQVIRSPFNRIVVRPQIGIAYRAPLNVKYYYQLGIFTGKDCLYSPLLGATVESGRSWKHLNAGLIIGGYFRDGSMWADHYYNGYSFIPIVGINLSIKKEFRRLGIELSNKITPIMTIHNISITYRFNTQLKQRSIRERYRPLGYFR